jgi:hypothetical protein
MRTSSVDRGLLLFFLCLSIYNNLEEWFYILIGKLLSPTSTDDSTVRNKANLKIYIPRCPINHSKNLVSFESLVCKEGIRKVMVVTRKNLGEITFPGLVMEFLNHCLYKIGNE